MTATTTTSLIPTTTTQPADAGTWSLIPAGPTNIGVPAGWSGREVLASRCGCCGELGSVNMSAFNPARGVWRQLPKTPLTPRSGAVGTWAGTEMIVVGGEASADGLMEHGAAATDGAAWNPATGSWRRIAPMPAPLPEGAFATAVWTGNEMIIWASRAGGTGGLGMKVAGTELVLAYNPATDTWRRLPASGLATREDPVVAWTGTELVVWGGMSFQQNAAYGDGARLDPATGTWRRLPAAPVPARGSAASAWTGREVVLWGGATGFSATSVVGQGAAYSPATDSWRTLPLSPLRAKSMATGVWTGRLFLVFGGTADSTVAVPGPTVAGYDPATNRWVTLPVAPKYPPTSWGPTGPASQRADALGVWTGSSALFMGGMDFRQQCNRSDGVAWTPAA